MKVRELQTHYPEIIPFFDWFNDYADSREYVPAEHRADFESRYQHWGKEWRQRRADPFLLTNHPEKSSVSLIVTKEGACGEVHYAGAFGVLTYTKEGRTRRLVYPDGFTTLSEVRLFLSSGAFSYWVTQTSSRSFDFQPVS